MKRLTSNQKGFTILELLITTLVFSVIFLGVTTALIQMSKLYYKGVVTGRTQEATRGIMDRVAQQLQFGNDDVAQAADKSYLVAGAPSGSLTFKAFCIGGTRYTYRLNTQVNKDVAAGTYEASTNRLRHAVWRDNVPSGSCEPANLSLADPSTGQGGEDMLGASTRLSEFSTSCTAADVCTVKVGIIYGDNDLIEFDAASGNPLRCRTIIGNQWCAASQFSTSVLKRVGS